ncbi:hypothetical protein [Thioclava sp.]|uniref:hypothetical protein n=1 Tax=Thioclava sp. TaxID=1933450 RepID=UPI003AA86FA0
MTMFSMKPKFDLAAFLAEPAPVGQARSRGARRQGFQSQPAPTSQVAAKAAKESEPDAEKT